MSGQNIFSLSASPVPALTPLGGSAPAVSTDGFAPFLAQAFLGGGNIADITEAILPQKNQDAALSQGNLIPFWPKALAVNGELKSADELKTEEMDSHKEPTGEEIAAWLPAIQQLLSDVSVGNQSSPLGKGDVAQVIEALAGISELKQQLSPKQIEELQSLIQGLTLGREAEESSSLNLPKLAVNDIQNPEAKSTNLRDKEAVEGLLEESPTFQIVQKLKSLLKEQTSGSSMEKGHASLNSQDTAPVHNSGNQPFMDSILPLTPTESRVQAQTQTPLEKALPMPAALKENVFEQVVRSMNFSIKEGQSEMQIHLKPDFLGQMSMKIAVEDGLVAASFTVENHQVKELLESSLANLRQSLTNQGLKVDTLTVSIGSGGAFSDLSQRQSNWAASAVKKQTSEEYREAETEIAQVSYEKGRSWTTSSMDYIV